MMNERFELYKAAKYQVEEYFEDHEMLLPKMWKLVNTDDTWKNECISDYEHMTYNVNQDHKIWRIMMKCFAHNFQISLEEARKFVLESWR